MTWNEVQKRIMYNVLYRPEKWTLLRNNDRIGLKRGNFVLTDIQIIDLRGGTNVLIDIPAGSELQTSINKVIGDKVRVEEEEELAQKILPILDIIGNLEPGPQFQDGTARIVK